MASRKLSTEQIICCVRKEVLGNRQTKKRIKLWNMGLNNHVVWLWPRTTSKYFRYLILTSGTQGKKIFTMNSTNVNRKRKTENVILSLQKHNAIHLLIFWNNLSHAKYDSPKNHWTTSPLDLPFLIGTKRIKIPFSAFCYYSTRERLLLGTNQPIIMQKVSLQPGTCWPQDDHRTAHKKYISQTRKQDSASHGQVPEVNMEN